MKQAIVAGFVLAVATVPAHAAKPAKAPQAAVATSPAQSKDIKKVVGWLEKGKWEKARKRLAKILEKNPRDATALKLIKQIDSEPKALLGASSIPYLVRPGDSYQTLAHRYLGDPLMFYALARYNGVSVPAKIKVGTTLRVPGAAQAAAEPKPAPAKAATKPSRASKTPKAKAAPSDLATPAPAKTRSDSPALAGALRRQGLSALAKGNPRGAVVLLERAAAADPGNRLVAADLARARRVRDAVR